MQLSRHVKSRPCFKWYLLSIFILILGSGLQAVKYYSAENGIDQVSDKYDSGKEVACEEVFDTIKFNDVWCDENAGWSGWTEVSVDTTLITEL